MSTVKSLLFLFHSPPYGTSYAHAGMDLMLTAATFDQKVTAVFIGDGVYHLVGNQDSAGIGLKNLSRAIPAFELYDITAIQVDESSLQERGLDPRELLTPVELTNSQALAARMDAADQVFTF